MQFEVNEIVWGKIKGYPYWPCRILYDIADKGKCRVSFFGEEQQGELVYSMIRNFEDYLDTYIKQYRKEKKLRSAVMEALEYFPHLANKMEGKTKTKTQTIVKQMVMSNRMLKILKYLEKMQKSIDIKRFEELYVLCGNDDKMLLKLIKQNMEKLNEIDEHYIQQQLTQWTAQEMEVLHGNEYKIFF